ncbi:MAG: hypothetical protein LUE13_02465 [Akkermansiaceae bacterium]|nr:hypothetical protein [Akkermansiaceae bacterium]
MMKFWWNRKKQNEPFDVMIEMLRKGNNPWAQDTSTQIAYSVMLETVLKIARRDKEEIIAMFSNDGIYQQGKEMPMLANVLNKITWDVIATGRYHLYRGQENISRCCFIQQWSIFMRKGALMKKQPKPGLKFSRRI